MFKNVATTLTVFCFDTTTNVAKTGVATSLTAYVNIDYAGLNVLASTTFTELSAANAAGYYTVPLAQAETNGNTLLFTAKSSVANVAVIGSPPTVQTLPSAFGTTPGAVGGLFLAGALNAGTTSVTAWTVNSLTAFTGAVSMPAGLTANITGNLSGTISTSQVITQVTGSVGSVTGNVGGTVSTSQTISTVLGNVNGNLLGTVSTSQTISTVLGNVNGNVTGSVTRVLVAVTANVNSWLGGVIPAPVVTGVPIVDTTYLLGTSSAGTAGYVGLDWQNIRAQTAVVALRNTTISTSQSISTVINAVGSVTGNVGGNVNGNVVGSVASVVGNVGGTISTSQVITSVTGNVNITSNRKKASSAVITFTMTSTATGADTPGLTVAGVISKDSASFAGVSNSIIEIGSGWYALTLTSAEMTANNVGLQFTAATATTRDILIQTQP